ncbi:hypothetical protein, partial [Lentzea albidocapillata]|uniref:hypothetical protein n=1 Tax=Lentzea albidocapillata TaxID=40571 RepID=UPI001B802AE3
MVYFAGNGAGRLYWGGTMSGQGDWANYRAITAGDYNGDGKTDIAGIDPGNTMVYFAGNGAGQLSWGGP